MSSLVMYNSTTTTTMTTSQIQTRMDMYITQHSKELIAKKPKGKQFLEASDIDELGVMIRSFWSQHCDELPAEFDSVISFACAAVERDKMKKLEYIRKALSTALAAGGIAAIISAVGLALGWGASLISSIVAFFAGISITGPIALAVIGGVATIIAGYMAFSTDEEEGASEKALKILREGIHDILPDVWSKYGKQWKD